VRWFEEIWEIGTIAVQFRARAGLFVSPGCGSHSSSCPVRNDGSSCHHRHGTAMLGLFCPPEQCVGPSILTVGALGLFPRIVKLTVKFHLECKEVEPSLCRDCFTGIGLTRVKIILQVPTLEILIVAQTFFTFYALRRFVTELTRAS
jgi:hypothetical protein